jgi:hypothetical protein
MKLRLVPPRQGLVWVRQGLRVFFRRPIAYSVLLLVYLLVGPLFMMALAPLASLAFMIATREAVAGRFAFPGAFVDPLRTARQRWAQLHLGVLYAIALALLFWLGDAVGGAAFDALRQAVSEGKRAPQDLQPLLSNPSLQFAWLLLAGGVGLLAVPFWHAPALVHWDGQGAAKALFSSTIACWRNKGALAVFTLGWMGVMMGLAFGLVVLFTVLGRPQLAFVAATPAMLMLSAAFYASLYFTFADSFEASGPGLSPSAGQEIGG